MSDEFYKPGLRFECTQCHACCRHEPGYVFLSILDLGRLASGTNLTDNQVIQEYCRTVDIGGFSRISLREKPNYDCVFWDEGCTVYDHRPLQCRAYPFWAPVLADESTWRAEMNTCPGMGTGKLHSTEDIDRWLEVRAQERLLTTWPNDE